MTISLDPVYPRNLVGYGRNAAHARWPNKARIALQFVINYEEGGENCVLHGDKASEQFLSEIVGAAAFEDRHMSMESIYEYGSRAGWWRLYRMFTERKIPVTVFGVGMALLRNKEAVAAMLEAKWEICSHGWRWIHYQHMDEATEREHMRLAVEAITQATGERPQGWYTGRDSPNTRRLVADFGGFEYDSDYYGDDLPLWTRVTKTNGESVPHLIVPYTLTNNDMRFAMAGGFSTGQQFFEHLKDAFDVLYAEGDPSGLNMPKMMNIGLHCRLIGQPARAAGLARFLDYAMQHDNVWFARRIEIARHWKDTHPFRG
jgi:allantoinase